MYRNAYAILGEVRRGLGEYSTAYVQGTDTTGHFDNSDIMQKINDAQRFLWDILFVRFPELFLTSTSLTAVSSVLTLPSDLHLIKRFENSDKRKIDPISVNLKHLANYQGSKYAYYRKGNTLVIDEDSNADTFTLWYFKGVRELDQGLSTAGGALSLTLATTARTTADYYNGMQIENVTDAWVDTISDYSAARVCTLAAQTGASSKYYGLISELPESFHRLIGMKALIFMKDDPKSPEKPTKTDLMNFQDALVEALRSYAGTNEGDRTMESVFLDFEPYF
jgi:hypothetical protein